MSKRKQITRRVITTEGDAVNIHVMDGILVDDLLILGMKAEGYRLCTGRDVSATVPRNIKDFLIRLGVIQD